MTTVHCVQAISGRQGLLLELASGHLLGGQWSLMDTGQGWTLGDNYWDWQSLISHVFLFNAAVKSIISRQFPDKGIEQRTVEAKRRIRK